MKHDTWTHAQAALLLCGLDPQHSAISDEGQLKGAHALMLDGSQLQWPDPPPIYPMITEGLLAFIKRDAEKRVGLEAKWRAVSQQVQDCLHWLQASPLPARTSPPHYLAWAKRKGLAEHIFTALGDHLASVLGEVDEQPRSCPDPPVQRTLPATAPAPQAAGPSPEDYLLRLAALFDPVKVGQLWQFELIVQDANRNDGWDGIQNRGRFLYPLILGYTNCSSVTTARRPAERSTLIKPACSRLFSAW